MPIDEFGWKARSHARLSESPAGAVEDLERALAITDSPELVRGNLAYIHSEVLNDTEKAIEILTDSLESNQRDIIGRAGRGVLYARLGREEEALADAKILLQSELDAVSRFQVACTYALLSRTEKSYQPTAIGILAQSLMQDLSLLDLVADDSDLDPIKDLAELKELVAACSRIRELSEPADTTRRTE